MQLSRLEKKDFSQEVRGARDIRNFLEKSQIILDLAKDQLEDIVDKLLEVKRSPSKRTKYVNDLHKGHSQDTWMTFIVF